MKLSIVIISVLCFFLKDDLYSQDGTWITLSTMPTPRQEMPHAVHDGKIYVMGGLLSSGVSTAVEIYTPSSDSWATGTPMPSPRHHHMTAVANGKIYVIGGYPGAFVGTSSNYEYDPVSDTWETKASMITPRGAGTAVEFQGKIYVFGGVGFGILGTNEVYDPVSNSWEAKSPMPTIREHLACAVIDSLIYVIGGRNFVSGPGNHSIVEAYSPATDTWYSTNSMLLPSGGLTASSSGGKLYKFGGEIPGVFDETEEFDPATGLWRYVAPMPTARHGMGSAVIGDTIYVIGGGLIAGLFPTNTNEAFIPGNTVSISHTGVTVKNFKLYQNYPNPFNPSTNIRFDIPVPGLTKLGIFDIRGREVESLLDKNIQAGSYEIRWDASAYPSGVYYYKIEYGTALETGKMILVK